MSTTITFVNWRPEELIPSLNQFDLAAIKATKASFEYYPYTTNALRNPSEPGQPGVWGYTNNLVVKPVGGGSSQVYNNLADPAGAAPNNPIMLWIFPDFLIFSQFEKQISDPVYPGLN